MMIDLILPEAVDPQKIKQALQHGKAKGIKKKDVAEKLGITPSALLYIATGETKVVSLQVLLTIQEMTGFELVDQNFFQAN